MLLQISLLLLLLTLAPYLTYLILYLIYMPRKENKMEIQQHTDYTPKISIVIPTYNEEKNIDKKLQNTLNTNYPVNKMEILVVDSSTDQTPKKVKEWMKKHPNIKLLKEKERKGLATALNLAYSKANGEIVIKSDCDLLLDENSLKQITSNFHNQSVGAVSGKQLLTNEIKHEKGYRNLIDIKRLIENRIDSIYLLEPFSAFRKSLIEPIDEKSVADDAELGLKIRKKGFKVLFDPKAYFYEKLPTNTLRRLKIKQRRAQGHIRLLLTNLNLLFNKKYGKYGQIVFPLNFYIIIIEPWLLISLAALLPATLFYIFHTYGLIISLLLYTILSISFLKGQPSFIAGFVESQIALIIGFLNLILKGPQYIWER